MLREISVKRSASLNSKISEYMATEYYLMPIKECFRLCVYRTIELMNKTTSLRWLFSSAPILDFKRELRGKFVTNKSIVSMRTP